MSYRLAPDTKFSPDNQLQLEFFKSAGQWELVKPVYLEQTYKTFLGNPQFTYDTIKYTFRFQRHPTFYVNVIILPSCLMTFLSVLCFILPVESGEKVSLGVTVLLSQVVELIVIAEILPPSAESFPGLSFRNKKCLKI